ncbi:hypothetical protein SCUCBS95973_001225 [Sporothrix curviconia]|uniref:Uncharacterized protein n=1 Tax=Sporothrix curviconia TaxID=1260050 RepID=A0ABP0AWV7_9PEZI
MKAHPNSFAARYAREKGKQPSDVSLALADSIDSAMSSDSEQVAYVISPPGLGYPVVVARSFHDNHHRDGD